MSNGIAYHSCQTCGRSFGLECQECGVPKVEFERRPSPTYEQQYPDREVARLRRELAQAQAEVKKLRTPPPQTPKPPSSASPLKDSTDDESQLLDF
mgnify:CR=1 FL=1